MSSDRHVGSILNMKAGRQPFEGRGYAGEGKGRRGVFSAHVDFCQTSAEVCEEIIVLYFLILHSLVVPV